MQPLGLFRPAALLLAFILGSSVHVAAQTFYTLISDPFMPFWPPAAPNGPVYFASPVAVPNSGSSLGVTTHLGKAFGLNNFNMLPVQQSITSAGTILSVQDVILNYSPIPQPQKAVVTLTADSRFVIVGTNTSNLYALEDIYLNQTRPNGASPSFAFKRAVFNAGTQLTFLNAVVGNAWAPSDFCDFDGDGKKDELLMGGSTGKLVLLKLVWGNPGSTSPTEESVFTTGEVSGFNTLAALTSETFSKPTCTPKDAANLYVAVGFRSGLIVTFTYEKSTKLWNFVQSIQIDSNKFVFSPPLGSPANNLFAAPAFIDLDGDSIMDGVAVGYTNGAMNLIFSAYSRGTTCTPPTCALGFFVLGCDCRPCPAGTYRASTTQQWCKVCGGVDSYCEEGAQYPKVRGANECTYWAPYPSATNPNTVSPYFAKDITYYTDNYGANGGAKVTLGDGSEININTYWNAGSMQQEMFGGMKNWRNRADVCGKLELGDTTYYAGMPNANSTFGFTPVQQLVRPADGQVPFTLANTGNTALNVTFNFGSNAYFASVIYPTQNFATVSKVTLSPGRTETFRLRVQTGSIPAALLVNNFLNLTLELQPEPYWKQQSGFNSETLSSVFLTFQLQLVEATLLAVPPDVSVDMQTEAISMRTIQIFNLEEAPSTLNINVQYLTPTSTDWLVPKLQGPPNSNVGPIAKCHPNPTCAPDNQQIMDFSRMLDITFNSSGLFNGYYYANVIINAVVVGCGLTVRGGPVLWQMSTIQFMDTAGQLVPIGGNPSFRVDVMPQIAIVARDSLGNPTDNYATATGGASGPVQLRVEWEWANLTTLCPVPAINCYGTIFANSNGQLGVFTARFQVFAQGGYLVRAFDPNGQLIGTRRTFDVDTLPNPMTFNVSAKVCAATSNSVPNALGSGCVCKPGFGVQDNSGTFSDIVCVECGKGTWSLGGQSPCNPCQDGYYQDGTGQTTCKRCSSFLEAPDLAKQSCTACSSFEYVRDDDPAWACTGCGENQRVRTLRDSLGHALNFTHPTLSGVYVNKYFCACNANMYWSNTAGKCVLCPTGGFCVDRDEDEIIPRYGYWGPIKENNIIVPNERRRLDVAAKQHRGRFLDDSNYTAPTFIRCRRAASCPGIEVGDNELGVDSAVYAALASYSSLSNSTAECTVCEEGFTGPLCFKCAGGYTRAGVDSCTKCLTKASVVGLLILGAIFAIIVCIYIIRRTLANMDNENDQSDEMILLRVLMSHLQSESMVQGIDLDWPAFVLGMFDVFNLISSTGQSAFSLDCFVDEDLAAQASNCAVLTDNRLRTFFLSALFIALLPVFGFVCSSIYWLCRYAYIKQTTGKGRGRSFYQYNLVSVIIIVFLLYPSLVRTGFKFFSGSSETIAGNRFLEADFNIIFGSSEHLRWALCLGLPMILIYALGVPFGFLYILRTRRADTHRYGKVFTFLYTGFQSQFYYWEVVIMFRKLGIAACTIMLRPYGSDIQAFATSIVVFASICLQLQVRPYIHASMNFLEVYGLTTLYMTLFLGLFQSSANINFGESSAINVTFGILIVLINVAFLVFIFGKLFQVTYNTGKEKGWRHALLMVVTLGNATTSTAVMSNRNMSESFAGRKKAANSLVDAQTESGNPVYTKELSPSAVPEYDDVYGKAAAPVAKAKGAVDEVSYDKPA